MKADAKPTFDDVAKLIANGTPPDWLVPGLEHFRGFIGSGPVSSKDRKHIQEIIARMGALQRVLASL